MSNPAGVLRPQYTNLGDCYLQVGPARPLWGNGSSIPFNDLGATTGVGSLKITPKLVSDYNGSGGKELTQEQLEQIDVEFEITLKEMTLANLLYKSGFDPASITQVALHEHMNEVELLNFTPWRDLVA